LGENALNPGIALFPQPLLPILGEGEPEQALKVPLPKLGEGFRERAKDWGENALNPGIALFPQPLLPILGEGEPEQALKAPLASFEKWY
jgi:hypothetical protein